MEQALINERAQTLEQNRSIRFVHDGCLYDIEESWSEFGGWVVNVYPDNDGIYDEDGELIEDEQFDGGLCTGSAADAITFMI